MKNKKIKKILVIIVAILLVAVAGFSTMYILNKDSNNTVDFSNYKETTVSKATTIKKEGVYNITGDVEGQILVDAKDANVKLVLENANITTTSSPSIYVKNAKSVYIEVKGENTLKGEATTDLNGIIYSKSDLTLQGDGTLNITSNLDGIVSKDNLKILSGTYVITADDDGIVGKDSVYVKDGKITINSKHDGIKASNEKSGSIKIEGGEFNITTGDSTDTSKDSPSMKGIKASGDIEITSGTFTIKSQDDAIHSNSNIKISGDKFTINTEDDGIHADSLLEINGGTFTINAHEGLEATYVKINDGTINISASDDGINAAQKTKDYTPTVEINGGSITIKMGEGDTDGIDSNGNLYINGGTINITGNSPFDYDGEAKYTGGKMIVNGEETTTITNQFMGGGMNPGGMNKNGMNSDNGATPPTDGGQNGGPRGRGPRG